MRQRRSANRWREGLPNLTPIAKDLWRALYPEPWPKGWKVEWAGFMRGAMGLTAYGERRVILSYGDLFRRPQGKKIIMRDENDVPLIHTEHYGPGGRAVKTSLLTAESVDEFEPGGRCPLGTLIHEFIHMRNGHTLRHGREFDRLHASALARFWTRVA